VKTIDLTVTASFDSEEEYDEFVDALADSSEPHSGAVSGPQWDSVENDG
jgi:hypothetical protein